MAASAVQGTSVTVHPTSLESFARCPFRMGSSSISKYLVATARLRSTPHIRCPSPTATARILVSKFHKWCFSVTQPNSYNYISVVQIYSLLHDVLCTNLMYRKYFLSVVERLVLKQIWILIHRNLAFLLAVINLHSIHNCRVCGSTKVQTLDKITLQTNVRVCSYSGQSKLICLIVAAQF